MNFNNYISAKVKTNPEPKNIAEMYIDLVKRSLTRDDITLKHSGKGWRKMEDDLNC